VGNHGLKTTGNTTFIVTCQFKQPVRYVSAVIDWALIGEAIDLVPSLFKPIVAAELEQSAKDILSNFIKGYAVGVHPMEIDAGMFSLPALIDQCTAKSIPWLSKEELTEQWRNSVTYQTWVTDTRFKTNKGFAQAVGVYTDWITRLAGKTSQYTPAELDSILAKLKADDYDSAVGQFILKRVAALQAKPEKADTVSMDCL
jgi:hypothetical protein